LAVVPIGFEHKPLLVYMRWRGPPPSKANSNLCVYGNKGLDTNFIENIDDYQYSFELLPHFLDNNEWPTWQTKS